MAATDTFERELTAAAQREMCENPFIAALTEGRASRDAIRRYTAGLYALSDRLPQRLLRIAAMIDDRKVRLALLENLLEEEGVIAIDGGHLVADDRKRHPNLARRLAHAAGATDDDLRDASAAAEAQATWLNDAIAKGRIAAALAYLTVGIEGNVPATMELVVDALASHYAFHERELEFLTSHIELDAGHAAAGARLVARIASTGADRADAIEGARRGGLAWYWWHRSFAD